MHSHRLIFILASLAACKGGSTGSTSGKAADASLFSSKVPPGDLAKVKAGMTQAEVKALFPKATKPADHSGSPILEIESGYSDARFFVLFYSDQDRVANVNVEVPKDLAKTVRAKWGPASESGPLGDEYVDDAAGYEVTVGDRGRKSTISYEPFQPANAAYFGAKPAPFDVLAKVKLGMTREEVTKAAPGLEGAPKGGGSYQRLDGSARGVSLLVDFDADDKLERMHVQMSPETGAYLVKAWGARPGKGRNGGGASNCWETEDKLMIIRQSEGSGDVEISAPDKAFCELQ